VAISALPCARPARRSGGDADAVAWPQRTGCTQSLIAELRSRGSRRVNLC
jgi:hypothetical protein